MVAKPFVKEKKNSSEFKVFSSFNSKQSWKVGFLDSQLGVFCESSLEYKLYSYEEILHWSFTPNTWSLSILCKDKQERVFSFSASSYHIHQIQKKWNDHYISWKLARNSKKVKQCCKECGLFFLSNEVLKNYFCLECHSIVYKGENTSKERKAFFDFDEKGDYSRVSSQGILTIGQRLDDHYLYQKNFLDQARVVVDKVCSHVLWLLFWQIISFSLSKLLSQDFVYFKWIWGLCLGMTFAHLVFIGYYFSGLVMTKSLRALLFPLKREKVLSLIKKKRCKEAEEKISQWNLTELAGVWFNLYKGYLASKDLISAKRALKKALSLCPNHPVFLRCYKRD